MLHLNKTAVVVRRGPLSRTRAIRALAEGAKPTLDLIADATGRALAGLRREAERDGWALDRVPPEDFAQRIRPILANLVAKAEALARRAAEEGGKIDRAEIDGVLAMVRALEKIAEFARPEEAAREKQIRRDEDLAAVLQRLNERIIHLARELAAQLVADSSGPDGRGTG